MTARPAPPAATAGAPRPAPPDPVQARIDAGGAVVLFDGVCSLCNGAVDFIIRHDPAGRFAFASLQSDEARAYLEAHGRDADALLDTVVLADRDGIHERSTAALRVLRGLGAPWVALYALAAVPRPARDAVYRYVAANRYRWFGTRETCRLPSPEERARFV
ncbi:thiol-disulfide oxidoreductase DCC family protein [Rubrivirga sp. S365]|uniref:thiol-disulfide oxidoreductase DCC family protein n=1 Tax=Rubrivirga sp. S365 TaxID=3076080 RepID=UPI0028C51D0C|nr:thiol-disulfide oxidoreductase DCC family protein [Rubrivirga sp. S365]MDT7856653.1 thiol-disulfide oxidoreductase DCC family protein [Rubrivirga sp. S365]